MQKSNITLLRTSFRLPNQLKIIFKLYENFSGYVNSQPKEQKHHPVIFITRAIRTNFDIDDGTKDYLFFSRSTSPSLSSFSDESDAPAAICVSKNDAKSSLLDECTGESVTRVILKGYIVDKYN